MASQGDVEGFVTPSGPPVCSICALGPPQCVRMRQPAAAPSPRGTGCHSLVSLTGARPKGERKIDICAEQFT